MSFMISLAFINPFKILIQWDFFFFVIREFQSLRQAVVLGQKEGMPFFLVERLRVNRRSQLFKAFPNGWILTEFQSAQSKEIKMCH